MKRLLLTIFFGSIISLTLLIAAPADEYWQVFTQPDGTTIELCLVGDEMERHYESRDGMVYELNKDGYWLAVDSQKSLRQIAQRRKASKYAVRPQRATGVVNLAPRGLVILVNYSDVKFDDSNDLKGMTEMLNGDNYTYDDATGSAKQYFADQSDGQYIPIFDVIGPVTLDKPRSYYGANSGSNLDVNAAQMAVDACLKADAAGADFTLYDNNNDGTVDFVFIIFADKGEADGGSEECIWPHNWYVRTGAHKTCVVDGLYIDNYACCGEKNGRNDKRTGIGTFCHEFSHVIGLPDYYDTKSGINYSNKLTPKYWSIMDMGCYLNGSKTPPSYSAFDKYYMGWHTPTAIGTAEQQITLSPISEDGYQTYQVTASGQLESARKEETIYYIECRQRTGWDAALSTGGLVIWQVKYSQTAWINNTPNNTAYAPRYTVLSASGSTTGLGTSADAYPGKLEVTEKQIMTNRNISNIVNNGQTVSFTFNRAPKTYPLNAKSPFTTDDKVKQSSYITLTGNVYDSEDNTYIVHIHLLTQAYAGTYNNNAFAINNTYLEKNGERLQPKSVSGIVTINGQNTYRAEVAMVIDDYNTYRVIGDFKVIVEEPKQYALDITCTEGGTVTLLADGYNSKTNSGTYIEGTTVQLVPTPLKGWKFISWTGINADKISTTDKGYFLTITSTPYSLQANFEHESCEVKTLVSPSDKGSITLTSDMAAIPSGSEVKYLSMVRATASPTENYVFDSWSDGITTNPRDFLITGDTVIAALFSYVAPEPEIHTITIDDSPYGQVTLRAAGAQDNINKGTYTEGTTLILIPTPMEGYRFAGWEGKDAQYIVNANNTYTLTIDKQDIQLTAIWEVLTYTVYVSCSPADKGLITLSSDGTALTNGTDLAHGTEIQIEVSPVEHYRFDAWSDGLTTNPRQEVIIGSLSLTALLSYVAPEPEIHTLTIADSPYGQVTLRAAGTQDYINKGTYTEGTTLVLLPAPIEGYRFAGWEGEDAQYISNTNNTYTLTIDKKDLNITPLWQILTFPVNITCSPADKGLITISADGTDITNGTAVAYGTEVEVNTQPVYGWQMISWNDGEQASVRRLTVTSAISLTALCQRLTYQVKTLTSPVGTGQIRMLYNNNELESGSNVPYEAEVQIVGQSNYGWLLTGWNDGVASANRIVSITSDTTLIATMQRQLFTINASPSPADKGSVLITANNQPMESGGKAEYETSVTLLATPSTLCHFTGWSDGIQDNPRQIRLTQDTALYALFERDSVPYLVLKNNEDSIYYDNLSYYEDAKIGLVVLNRTIKPNTYSTLCLPFDVPDLHTTDLCGSVFKFVSATGDAVRGMSLNFTFTNEIKAGVPYLLLATDSIIAPFFKDVTFKRLDAKILRGGEVEYRAVLRPINLKGMGKAVAAFNNNMVYYPGENSNMRVPAFQAYFYIPANAQAPIERINILPMEETDLKDAERDDEDNIMAQ